MAVVLDHVALASAKGTVMLYELVSHRLPSLPWNWLAPRLTPLKISDVSAVVWPSPTTTWNWPALAMGAAMPVKVSLVVSLAPLLLIAPSRVMMRRRMPELLLR